MSSVHGFGLGIASKSSAGEVLDVFYPAPLHNISGDLAEVVAGISGELDASGLNDLEAAFRKVGAEQQALCAATEGQQSVGDRLHA